MTIQAQTQDNVFHGSIAVSVGATTAPSITPEEKRFIETVVAICGSGKTYAYTKAIKSDCGLYIVACKTNLLASQVYAGLIAEGVNSSALITGADDSILKKKAKISVTSALRSAITTYSTRVIISTHRGLEILAEQMHMDDTLRLALNDYSVIVDEAPTARKAVKAVINLEMRDQYIWPNHAQVVDGMGLAMNPRSLRRSLVDTRHRGLVIALINGEKIHVTEDEEAKTQTWQGYARSDLFAMSTIAKRFTIVGSRIDKSPFAVKGREVGIEFAPSNIIQIDPSRAKYRRQERIELCSLMSDEASKRKVQPHLEEIAAHAAKQMLKVLKKGEGFIYASNLDDVDPEYGALWSSTFKKHLEPIGGVAVPFLSAGLNDYRGYQTGLWLGIAKLSPAVKASMSPELAKAEEEFATCESAYQFIGRTALRNIEDDQTALKLVFLDEHVRDFVAGEYLPNATVVTDLEQFQFPERTGKKTQAERVFTKGDATKQRVYQAADLVKLSGVKVTAKAVFESLQGDVSLATVKRAHAEWKAEQAA